MTGISIETIGPKEATALLALNTHNRTIRINVVNTIKRDIANGDWRLNGETIKISKTNVLIDGQHRLLGIVEAGVPVQVVVVRGLDDDVQSTVDTGAKRGLRDYLKWQEETAANNLAATIRASWFLAEYGQLRSFGIAPSQAELIAHFEKNPGLRDASFLGNQAAHSVLQITGSIAGAMWYHMGLIDPTLRDEFWRQLLENEATKGSAIDALRESLLKDLSRPHRMDVLHRGAVIIKAWNYWLEGREMAYIMWRGGGSAPEPFPQLQRPE